jgi:hypothetical protein
MNLSLEGVLPELAREIEELLRAAGEPELAGQVQQLRIVDRCRCGDDSCATIFVQPKPEGSYGPTHRNVALAPSKGMIILDVDGDRIACIEVLFRGEIRRTRETWLP